GPPLLSTDVAGGHRHEPCDREEAQRDPNGPHARGPTASRTAGSTVLRTSCACAGSTLRERATACANDLGYGSGVLGPQRVGEAELLPAAGAQRVMHLDDLAAARARVLGLVGLVAVHQ